MTAPPMYTDGISRALPILAQITPMVDAVPKEVPVSADIPQQSRNVSTR